MIIPIKEIKYIPNSWVDEKGRVFYWKNRLFRGIYPESVTEIQQLIESGLVDDLFKNKIFPKTWITDFQTENFPLIIEHEIINPIIYPSEWSFLMLKDAAITVLKVNEIAQNYDYQIKDCHGGNILFKKLNPIFIDLGSFVPYRKGSKSWIAYEEFMRYYYYPLKIWSKGDSFSARRFLFSEYGFIPNETINSFNNRFVNKNLFTLYLDIKFKYFRSDFSQISSNRFKTGYKKYLLKFIKFLSIDYPILKRNFGMNILENKINKINKPTNKSMWGDYHNENYNKDGKVIDIKPRFEKLIELLKSFEDINSVVDVAGNQGFFSNLITEKTNVNEVFTLDYDENAVDNMYIKFKQGGSKVNGIILQNLILPIVNRDTLSPNFRFSADAVFALAVTHHLVLTQKFTLDKILKTICSYSKKYVFIEFMPLGLWDGKSAPNLPDWYNLNWFRNSFLKYSDIVVEEKLEENRIIFVGILKEVEVN